MDISLLLRECHGSEIIFDWSGNFKEGRTAERKETMDGLNRTSCNSLFQFETVLHIFVIVARK